MHEKQRKLPAAAWDRLVYLRGLLALYVVLHHVRNELWPLMREIQPAGGLWYLWNAGLYLVLGHGLLAVFLFFVVSGFSIHGGSVLEKFQAMPFYVRRLRRLYPALLASLLISALLFSYGLEGRIGDQWPALLATLTFAQEWLQLTFAGNSPYWSLGNEGCYYLVYPLLVAAIRRRGHGQTFLGAAAACVVLTLILHPASTVVIYAPVWLAGAWLAERMRQEKPVPVVLLVAGLLLVAASLVSTLLERSHPVLGAPLWKMAGGIGCTSLVALWLDWRRPPLLPDVVLRGLHWLGDVSYSLYLNHFLVIAVIARLFPQARDHFGSATLTSLLAVAFSLLAAWASHRLVEQRFLLRAATSRDAQVPVPSATPTEVLVKA